MGRLRVREIVLAAAAIVAALASGFSSTHVSAQSRQSSAIFLPDGKLKVPSGFRHWVFVGGPLTPNGLNGGKAGFPEFHNVYVEARNIAAYKQTGVFPEGTLIVKELTLVLKPTFPDGSRTEPSGRGFFNGAFNGIDATVKDSKRFAKTNGWGFFTFGHHALPYSEAAGEAPVSECAGCHMANVAKTDITRGTVLSLAPRKIAARGQSSGPGDEGIAAKMKAARLSSVGLFSQGNRTGGRAARDVKWSHFRTREPRK